MECNILKVDVNKLKRGTLIVGTKACDGDLSFMDEPIKFISVCGCGHSIKYEWQCVGLKGKVSTMTMENFKKRTFILFEPDCPYLRRLFCCKCPHS